MVWPKMLIYEINAWVWLSSLQERFHRAVDLQDVPNEVLDEIAGLNVNAVWLMGVWERSSAARQSALNYLHEYRPVLPDLTNEDVIGSAYAIGAYEVDSRLGGRAGLAALRLRLAERGLKLILDFVPNHVACDHPWIATHPERFVCGTKETLASHPGLFFDAARPTDGQPPRVVAHGRDPYFPGWIDTAQLNAYSAAYREAAVETLLDLAGQCDGVRCDMAMLMTNSVFRKTWSEFLDDNVPETEFWPAVIAPVKAQHPDFTFIAEVYWGMEYDLLQQGFDYTYDKVFYDRVLSANAPSVREHLQAPTGFHHRQVRFIENHDEPRVVSAVGVERSRAAAVLLCTLPNSVLLHDGQLAGRRIKLPVQIKRQPSEPVHYPLKTFYHRLLSEVRSDIYHQGEWTLLEVEPAHNAPDGIHTHAHLIACLWHLGEELRLIVVNLTGVWSHGLVKSVDWRIAPGEQRMLVDVLTGACTFVEYDTLLRDGLTLALEAHQAMILRVQGLEALPGMSAR